MEARQFDDLLRSCTGMPSRRAMTRALSGLAFGGVLGLLGLTETEAKRKHKKKRKRKRRKQKEESCTATCAGKTCGDDGCGGSCGECFAGAICCNGACATECCAGCTSGGCFHGACACTTSADCPASCSYCLPRFQGGMACVHSGPIQDCIRDEDCQPGGFCAFTGDPVGTCTNPC